MKDMGEGEGVRLLCEAQDNIVIVRMENANPDWK
jgi:hypothetical protein